jgi:CheY-like chemotaxis protein
MKAFGREASVADDSQCSKILVVEDDPDTREILVEFFVSHGYEVTAVSTAEAGLEELQQSDTDVVLSDNQLDGGRTGSWMLRRAFEEGLLKKVAAVMYTADSAPHVPRKVRVLRKPTALREIELTAERAVDSARARR